MLASDTYTEFKIDLVAVEFNVTYKIIFPKTWIRVCLSVDSVSGRIRMAVNGDILYDKTHQEAVKELSWWPARIGLVLGRGVNELTDDTLETRRGRPR